MTVNRKIRTFCLTVSRPLVYEKWPMLVDGGLCYECLTLACADSGAAGSPVKLDELNIDEMQLCGKIKRIVD